MIPYSKQIISKEDVGAVKKVLNSDFLTQGPEVKKFEQILSNTCNAKYSTIFNSATSALHIACLSLGVGKGDTVWTSTNSFVASANCALYCGASVDLVDLDIKDFNINIDLLEKKLIQSKKKNKLPKVIIPVHFGGLPCDMKRIFKLSKKYNFKIIEDASHALGAKYLNSKIGDCRFSDITVFSFHPIKIITTAEGGAALTNNKKIYEKLDKLRNHGITRNKKFLVNKKKAGWYYEFQELGYNYRINDIQSALGSSQIKRLKKWVKHRNQLAKNYFYKLRNLPFQFQQINKGIVSSYHLFVVLIKKNKKGITRDKLYDLLKKRGIATNVHYIPIHTHPYFKKRGFKEKYFLNAKYYYKNCLSLPMYAGLSLNNQKKIINHLIKIFQEK